MFNRSDFGHTKCDLLTGREDDDIINYSIEGGIFIKLRRWCSRQRILYPEHPRAQKNYRSDAAKKNEQARQLARYPFTIHPYSKFNLVWEYVMCFVYFYMIFVYSLNSLFLNDYENYFNVNIAKCVGDAFFFVDLIQLFFEGYYDPIKSKSVLDLYTIFWKYLKTYFVVDFLSLIPSVCFLTARVMDLPIYKQEIFLDIATFAGMLRFLRINRFLEAIELIKETQEYSDHTFKALKAILLYVLTMLFLHSVLFVVNHNIDYYLNVKKESNVAKDYLSASLILCLVTHGLKPLHNITVHMTIIVSFLLAFVVSLFLHVECFQVWNKFYSAKRKYDELMQQIKQYMTYKVLPVNIKEKIWLYFKFKYQNKFFNEAEINSVLSNAIKEEVMMNIAEKNLAQTAFLKSLPRLVLCKVVANLISEIYLPDDVIIVAGDHADSMYFIYYGTVAVYNEHNKEVCHLKDGDYFGDVDMYFEGKRTHSVVAITPCEVFMLKKSTILLILDDYPKLRRKFKNFSRENLTEYSASKYPYIEL
ncbi:unnamed protein product [Psylliodes chrysocephalus]|uniref:Cyclic nucleotide-binding domain-containing protein n=1 Tax=Psylliodes chrysocephalus TaxID=3402493 RepID=A0A9P0CR42_9CUCU|nr:unnamed protein product [Psylliodes chrysocephala]